MDAALKKMFTLRKPGDLKLAALENSRAGYRDSRKSPGAFRYGFLSRSVQPRDETAAEFFNFGKGMRFPALVDGTEDGSFRDGHRVRFKVPVGIRSILRGLRKQFGKSGGCAESYVFAKIRPNRIWSIERGRIALIQSHDLGNAGGIFPCSPSGEQQAQDNKSRLH